jgi:hypothetical protein
MQATVLDRKSDAARLSPPSAISKVFRQLSADLPDAVGFSEFRVKPYFEKIFLFIGMKISPMVRPS